MNLNEIVRGAHCEYSGRRFRIRHVNRNPEGLAQTVNLVDPDRGMSGGAIFGVRVKALKRVVPPPPTATFKPPVVAEVREPRVQSPVDQLATAIGEKLARALAR